jgi:hypothetical protein
VQAVAHSSPQPQSPQPQPQPPEPPQPVQPAATWPAAAAAGPEVWVDDEEADAGEQPGGFDLQEPSDLDYFDEDPEYVPERDQPRPGASAMVLNGPPAAAGVEPGAAGGAGDAWAEGEGGTRARQPTFTVAQPAAGTVFFTSRPVPVPEPGPEQQLPPWSGASGRGGGGFVAPGGQPGAAGARAGRASIDELLREVEAEEDLLRAAQVRAGGRSWE